jgi:hypothetical protein
LLVPCHSKNHSLISGFIKFAYQVLSGLRGNK